MLGKLYIDPYGRKFRYSKAGSTALAVGKITQAAAATANHVNMAVASAAAIGATSVTVTLGATAATLDQYAGGWLQVNDATGEGYQYRVDSHPAADASASCVIKLDEPIQVALVAGTSQVSLIPNSYAGTAVSTTEEAQYTGVPLVAVPANAYYWSQTGGDAICLAGGTQAVGSMLTGGSTAGELVAINSTLDVDQPIVAIAKGTAGVDTEYKPVYLMID
jgi:hypothetical protein